jgi:hypothetical protein
MKIRDLIKFSADFLSPGAAHAPSVRHHGVVSRHMKKMKLRTRPSISDHIKADASPSDLASHHTWQEPSASDLTIKNWRNKRRIEKTIRRNLDPFAEGARIEASKPVTGPCGCTLALGDRVIVEGIGKGKIKSRNERMLTVALDNGNSRTIDQKFVHQLQSAGTSEGAEKGWDTRGRGRRRSEGGDRKGKKGKPVEPFQTRLKFGYHPIAYCTACNMEYEMDTDKKALIEHARAHDPAWDVGKEFKPVNNLSTKYPTSSPGNEQSHWIYRHSK